LLAHLWDAVVKPVIDRLGFRVSLSLYGTIWARVRLIINLESYRKK
jgi:hypothetical protein